MNEFERPADQSPVTDTPPVTDTSTEVSQPEPHLAAETPAPVAPLNPTPPTVDPIRSAAGRLGGQRVHRLAELGREYEREHGLKPGRQRRKQLVQLGKRYEVEHGLRAAAPKRRWKGDAWQEFVSALARVVKPAHRPAVEHLAAALRSGPKGIAESVADQAA